MVQRERARPANPRRYESRSLRLHPPRATLARHGRAPGIASAVSASAFADLTGHAPSRLHGGVGLGARGALSGDGVHIDGVDVGVIAIAPTVAGATPLSTPDRFCYAETEPIQFSGQGFTPNGDAGQG